MPIYEYTCDDCSEYLEQIMKLDEPSPVCPKCERPMTKIMSHNTFQLKGECWAKDGYHRRPSIKPENIP